jgi:ATP synthase protein I
MVRAVPAGMSGIALPDMSESGPPDPLARLGKRLDKARARRDGQPMPEPDNADLQRGAGLGFRIGIEFVVAIVIATGLGWALDRWLGTRPWGTIVLFFLGVGAGMLSVYRAVAGIRVPVGSRPLEKIGSSDRKPKDDWDDDEA